MRRISCATILLAVVSSFLIAGAALSPAAGADEKTGEDARANSLYPGSWSLQFQITEEFGLRPFNGMMVSVKRHWSRHSALRLGLQVATDWGNSTSARSYEVADTLVRNDGQDSDENHENFAIDLSYVRYPWPGSHVNFFWGAGPLVAFSRSEQTYASGYFDEAREDHNWRRDYARSWNLGAQGLLGVEWFLSKHFSFHSEYRASITYGRLIQESEDIDYYPKQRRLSTAVSDGWDFKSAYATLGLSVYF